MATRLQRGPFEIVDDRFSMRVRNTDDHDVLDVTIRLLDDGAPAEQHVTVLRPGDEVKVTCPRRLFAGQPTRLEMTWRARWGQLVSKTVML